MNNTFLLDNDFLINLDNYKQRELWVKIIALTLNEEPVEEITGRITGGSISVDGSSKLRRSCSLNLVSDRLNINEYLWGLNTKVKISIGMKNFIDPIKYGDIVWFKQGTFVLNSFNISINNNTSTISLQGKDKMCLLNGDLGGNLTALTYAFDLVEEEYAYDSYYRKKLLLKYIIREAVHTFANEPYHNIIINDLDDWGLELLTYRGEDPMYFTYSVSKQDIISMTINPQQSYKFNGDPKTIEQLELTNNFKFKVLNTLITENSDDASIVYGTEEGDNEPFQIIKIEYGMTCGYRITDLIYPQDLILNVGDNLTAMLDKLVSMLGNFEYFYNLDGQFVFQKKRTYIDTSWSPLTDNKEEQWVESGAYTSSSVYSLYNSKLVSSFSNSPALNNVKNDFSVWGTRKGVTGIEMPIHMRYAIDKKPTYYKNIKGQVFLTDQSVYESMKNDLKNQTVAKINDKIQNFRLQHNVATGLPEPIKQADGSWSPGWWDIRDWHDFYVILTDEEPKYTMKWYSKNDLDGCVQATSLNIPYDRNVYDSSYVWLLIYDPIKQIYNPQHGYGNPAVTPPQKIRTLYYSFFDDNNDLQTKKVVDKDGNFITKEFKNPYAGCSDDHTYLRFLKEDVQEDGNIVYFYNPDFPNYNSFEDLVKDKIEQEFKEQLESGKLNLVDWREIIYQMAKDHNKYGNMDNSNPAVQLLKVSTEDSEEDIIITKEEYDSNSSAYSNPREISLTTAIKYLNPSFYPSGYTGYEQYYIDILGFWRNLYNPEYTGPYEIEPLTRLDFEAIQEENKVFYEVPEYKQCSEVVSYYDDIDYYEKQGDTYVQVSITETEFKLNKSQYYYIADMVKAPVPIKKLELEAETLYYETMNHSNSEQGKNITEPKKYSIRHEKIERVPVFKLDPYYAAYLFTEYDPLLKTPVPIKQGITEADYLERPWKYFRSKSGVQTCCTSIRIPESPGRTEDCWFENYHKQRIETYEPNENCSYDLAWDLGDSVALNKNTTNEQLKKISLNATRCDDTLAYQKENMPWYFCYKAYTYEPLVGPAVKYDPKSIYYIPGEVWEFNKADTENEYWRADLLTDPESLIFWFDFLDTEGELDNYSVPRIGDRPKAVNDKDVKAIYFRETPGVIFLESDDWEWYTTGNNYLEKPTGYAYCQMPSYFQHLFSISSQGKSAKDVVDEYLYKYSYCTESVSVSTLPIYHLEPNTRIVIRDDASHINGEYIINKMTIPLDPKGSMTINAIKAVDRLY